MRLKKLLFIVIPVLLYYPSVGQLKQDKKLQKKVKALLTGFNGSVGVYVQDIKKGRVVAINADSIFPTASMVKVPILIGVMDKMERGELQYDQELIYHDSLLYEGVDILGSFKTGEKIELGKVMMLMLTMSDNTASLWLQSLAGTGARINQILDSMGFQNTRVNSRTPGRELNRSTYGWGQTTPREMSELLLKIYRKQIFSADACTRMMRVLGRNYWDENALSAIPATVQVFSKNGAVNASRSEVLLVNLPGNPYVFCICTKNNKDERWTPDNEAVELARKLSALLWDHFN